ncbi:MAG: hypothetical protein NT178_07065 [Proteobacteria bacterium]|nr:hypothetical protein [Pseudomonadota bacterium]
MTTFLEKAAIAVALLILCLSSTGCSVSDKEITEKIVKGRLSLQERRVRVTMNISDELRKDSDVYAVKNLFSLRMELAAMMLLTYTHCRDLDLLIQLGGGSLGGYYKRKDAPASKSVFQYTGASIHGTVTLTDLNGVNILVPKSFRFTKEPLAEYTSKGFSYWAGNVYEGLFDASINAIVDIFAQAYGPDSLRGVDRGALSFKGLGKLNL